MKIYTDYWDVLDGYVYDLETDMYSLILQVKPQEIIYRKKELIVPLLAEELPDAVSGLYIEGLFKRITVNAYERDLHARQACIEHYKEKWGGRVICWVCGFDFGKFYCDEMMDKIHIHHKKPLHEIKKEYEVDPINDLIPVCPNCHYTIHVLNCTPENLQELLARKLNYE